MIHVAAMVADEDELPRGDDVVEPIDVGVDSQVEEGCDKSFDVLHIFLRLVCAEFHAVSLPW